MMHHACESWNLMNIMDWFPEFILGPGLKQICTAVRSSLGLGFFMEMLLGNTETTHCQSRTKVVLHACLYASFSLLYTCFSISPLALHL